MKKTFAIIAFIIMLFPIISFAEPSLDFYAGYCHIEMDEKNGDAPFIVVLHFTENHKCYYSEKKFYPDHPGQDNAFIGTWEYDTNNDIVVSFYGNAVLTLRFVKDDLINIVTRMIYNRVNAIWT